MDIQTPRLILTPIVASDTDGIHSIRGRKEVMKWSLRGLPETPAETAQWVSNVLSSPAPWICFAVRERASPSGSIVGSVGVRYIHDRLSPDADDFKRWEMGYIFHPDWWGKGYATESVQGVVEGWNGLGGIRETTIARWKEGNGAQAEVAAEAEGEDVEHAAIWAITNADNEGSQGVLKKSGFDCVGSFVDVYGKGCMTYKILIG
ncbi:hypothetical protein FE257_010245 [Aspergillus nanangensis]|uniref:N-acetyltransferase domain-containing protein n=1 Tax=Aspergillus nanangensis TaxID=2582783 RepID=A0AAD4CJ05_ASPNN|nr:hypothetical protein FE257_010245 [Aspergillus nanangensis]